MYTCDMRYKTRKVTKYKGWVVWNSTFSKIIICQFKKINIQNINLQRLTSFCLFSVDINFLNNNIFGFLHCRRVKNKHLKYNEIHHRHFAVTVLHINDKNVGF